jgi:hypothetical protein
MKYKLPIAIGGAVAAIGASSVMVFADTTSTGAGSNSLAAKIAAAFHLNQADVQKVIDQNRQDHQAKMEQNYEDRLSQAVTDGKITSAQKDLILAKHKEVASFVESLQGKTPQERRDAMKAEVQQVQQWAKDNNVPFNLVMPAHRGMGMRHMDEPDGDADDSSSNSNSSTQTN